MFCCTNQESAEDKEDKRITREIKIQQREWLRNRDMLLLGASGSGKSTIIKQIRIFCDGYTDQDRQHLIPLIHQFILSSIKGILEFPQLNLPSEAMESVSYISSLSTTQMFTPELIANLKILLKTQSMMLVIMKYSEIHEYDHLQYWLAKIDEIVAPEYLPTNEDILRLRVQKSGIIASGFNFYGINFRVIDVGGQRTERRKWIFFFEHCSAVIFALALNEYDMQSREDPTVNRLQEALTIFKNSINNEFLKNTPIIIVFNKIDLFERKLQHKDFRQCFPDFTGEQSYETAMKFIRTKLASYDLSTNRRRCFYCNATDLDSMSMVVKQLTDIQRTLMFPENNKVL